VALCFALIAGGRADFHCGWPVSDGLAWGDDRVSVPHFFLNPCKTKGQPMSNPMPKPEENDLIYRRLRRVQRHIKRTKRLLAKISTQNYPTFLDDQALLYGSDLNRYMLEHELKVIFQMLRETRIRVDRIKFLFKKQSDVPVENTET